MTETTERRIQADAQTGNLTVSPFANKNVDILQLVQNMKTKRAELMAQIEEIDKTLATLKAEVTPTRKKRTVKKEKSK